MALRSQHKRTRAHRIPEHRRVRLRVAHTPRLGRYLQALATETYFLQIIFLLVVLWLVFSGALLLAERNMDGTSVTTYGQALYWGIAALSTAGIADTPKSGLAQAIGGLWIVVGSAIFFGTIVGSITGYFLRPVQRPVRQIIDTIEYNLEHLEDLSIDELGLLKKTMDGLILHVERLKAGSGGNEGNSKHRLEPGAPET